jgi:DNA polymerase I-like protein with 3'-5' exonuclease and polymerase domains
MDLPWEMEADGVTEVVDRLLLPAAKHFAELEARGMKVDVEYLTATGEGWKLEQDEITTDLYDMTESWDRPETPSGRPWFSAPARLIPYLYDELGLRSMVTTKKDGLLSQRDVQREIQEIIDIEEDGDEFGEEAQDYWRTASSAVFSKMKPTSTTTYMLYWLGFQHPFPRAMVPWRKLDKKITTYYQGYLDIMRAGGRIHPRYRVHGARTGRISCTDPNIHGVARLKEIKRVFVADEGYELLYSDRSQAEIRMLAHVSGDDTLREACESSDIHFAIACDLFQMTPDQMRAVPAEKKEFMRRAAKTIAFGIIYGRMPNSLAPQLGCSVEEATVYRERFLARMNQARVWIDTQRRIGRQMREVESIYGRKRRFPFIIDSKHASEVERQAVNTPIQGAVSDMTLEDNLRIIAALKRREIDVLPWPHVHDGFMVQVEKRRISEAVEIAKDILAHPTFETRVHFAVEMMTGPNWAELETVHKG